MSHRRGGNRRSKTDGQRRSMDAASVSSVEDTPYVSTLEENSSSSERQSDTIDLTRLGSHRQGSGGMTSDGGISGSGFVDLRQVDSQPLHRPTSSYGGVDIDLSLAVDGTNSSSMPRSSNIIGTNNASHHRTSSSSSTSSAMPEQYLASSLLSSSQQPSPYNKTSATTNQDDNNSSFIDADVVDVSALEKLADGEGVSGRARASSETEAIALGLMSPSGEFGPSPCREDVVRALTAESQFPLDQGDHLIGGDWVKDVQSKDFKSPSAEPLAPGGLEPSSPGAAAVPLDGALQVGEMAHPWTWKYFGMYYQYFVVGIFSGAMSPLMYPVFSFILGMASYSVKGGYQVMTVWWSLKIFIGACSDCVPIYGYRRKPYIIAGWVVTCIMLAVLMTLGQPKPGDAPFPYLLLLSAVNLAYIWADVATDGMLTDFAAREPQHIRGRLQSSIYTLRFVAMAMIASIMAFGFSSKEYGGSFAWSLSLPQLLAVLLGLAAIGIYPYTRLYEENHYKRLSYVAQFKKLYQRIKLNAVWRVISFSFFVHFFAYFSNTTGYDVARQWCHVEPWVEGLFSNVLANLAVAVGVFITKRYFINTSWRKLLGVTIVLMSVSTYIPAVLIDLGIIRSQFFYVGAPLMNQFIYGIFFIVCTYCAVEVAEKGSEGITFGLITTVGNLAIPFANVLSAVIASRFEVYDNTGKKLMDTDHTRHQMLGLDTTIFLLQLLAIPMLFILPPQKAAIQDLLASGRKNEWMAAATVIFLIFALCWSITGNLLQIFESTSCLQIVGGRGC